MTTHPNKLVLKCFAKVNLALAVGPPDARGYHPIASWVTAIDLCDELTVERLADGAASRYEIVWDDREPLPPRRTVIDWPVEKDLTVRGHRLLEESAGRALPVAMTLRKRTPVGGGLGGGSADGAMMLRAVDALFGLGKSAEELQQIAGKLGSDLAFFIDGERGLHEPPRPALMSGFGNELRRTARVAADLLLLIPEFGTPTGPVYKAFDAMMAPGAVLRSAEVEAMIARCAERGRVDSGVLFNDLAAPAERVEPRLAEVRRRAAGVLGVPVHLTGSGSTMFVVAGSEEKGMGMGERVAGAGVGVVVVRCVG